jgi:hypothetical protein
VSLSGASPQLQEGPRHFAVKRGGDYLYTMCDRGFQAAQFNLFFRHNVPTELPQFYLLEGEAGQGHDSFVQRLIMDKIKPYAADRHGALEGAVHHIKPWVHPLDNLDDARESVKIGIFEAIAPAFNSASTSISQFCSHPKLKPFPYVIIQHDFIAEDWGEQLKVLIDWYVNSYWMAYTPGVSRTQFLIFLNFIYPSRWHPIWRRLLPSMRYDKRAFQEFLRRLSVSLNKTYPCLLFKELGHPDKGEVCRTLGELGFHDRQECPKWLKKLYRRKLGRVKMADIERGLKSLPPQAPLSRQSIR